MKQDNANLPIGGRLWQCARYLCTRFAQEPLLSRIRNGKVIDLGAGTGVCGLAAAALGARHVVLTDRADVTPLLAQNIAHFVAQRLPGATPAEDIHACELDWGELCEKPIVPPYDVVIACEVLYSMQCVFIFPAGVCLRLCALRVHSHHCFSLVHLFVFAVVLLRVRYRMLLQTMADLTNTDSVVIVAHKQRIGDNGEAEFFTTVAPYFDIVRSLTLCSLSLSLILRHSSLFSG